MATIHLVRASFSKCDISAKQKTEYTKYENRQLQDGTGLGVDRKGLNREQSLGLFRYVILEYDLNLSKLEVNFSGDRITRKNVI